jgi:NAD-dependent DNA ligase
MMSLDDRQTLEEVYSLPALQKKVIQELYDIAARVVYDGIVDDGEVEFLRGWLKRNARLADTWPMPRLVELLMQVLADGRIDARERLQLGLFLSGIAIFSDEEDQGPLQALSPEIAFEERSFLFLGQMEVLKGRANSEVQRLGGRVAEMVTADLDYLVLGKLDDEHWKASSQGPAIQSVRDNQRRGAQTLIVNEIDFVRAAIRAI